MSTAPPLFIAFARFPPRIAEGEAFFYRYFRYLQNFFS